ncbi:MAG: leucyl aminopeptidase [Deltaproteobacteria bacterium]|jgi:leucyl aminopeptidase|nr:leucyl aminopeptidase [Deltaproteobacteria bacterium]
MLIKHTSRDIEKHKGDMLVYCVYQQDKKVPVCDNKYVQDTVRLAFKAGDFVGKEGETLLFYPTAKAKIQAKRILVVGLGKKEEAKKENGMTSADLWRENYRKAGGRGSTTALRTKAAKIMTVMPEPFILDFRETAECLTEGLLLGAYQFRKYKKTVEEDEPQSRINEIQLYSLKEKGAVNNGLSAGKAAAMAGTAARDMANEPGNVWTPTRFAEHGRKLAKTYSLSCKILSKSDMKRLKMGGILGVNSGSDQPPKMVILEYKTSARNPTLLMVGKGLTFDSGGISLKPPKGMDEMKFDMCGGAAVLGAMQAVGEEQPKGINVVGIVPATENLPGPSALKPGDIITIYGGKTVEVLNTDAEGRLILADALAYGIKQYKPKAVVDLATLTGAVVIGLGHHRTGLLSNDDDLAQQVTEAGNRSGEPVWRLPLGPEYSKQIKSKVADIKNIGSRAAGTITAAAFLQEFVGDTAWAHLDIAGTAYNFTEKSYIPNKGPSGIGVRTLLELIRNWKQE